MNTWLSWSSGKDSAWALHALRRDPAVEVTGLFTTVTEAFDRVSMHGVRSELLRAQAAAADLPLHVIEIPAPCPNEVYEARLAACVERARAEGVGAMAFGDLFLEDIRRYREDRLAGTGIAPVFPIWGHDTRELATEMVEGGLRAIVTCVDPRQAPATLAGRAWEDALREGELAAIDPCGENGEFHTYAWAGPAFREPIATRAGEVVTRDGFVFADILPAP